MWFILFVVLSLLPLHLKCAGVCDTSCDYCLSSFDFTQGTYRIQTQGKYCLSESIEFNPLLGDISNPNEGPNQWFPTNSETYAGCAELTDGAFALGFFAMITVETNDVEIDLKGFELSMHFSFYIQQRWFSIIEIGKAPFLSGFGPSSFGVIESVQNVYIHDGKLGLSSHHGIHSNDAHSIKLENLHIYDFEVGGIQFNGFESVDIQNIEIGPSKQLVPVSGYYSNARFLSMALLKLINSPQLPIAADNIYLPFSQGRKLNLTQIYDNLVQSMDIAYRYFLDANTEEDKKSEIYDISVELYANTKGLPDGSAMYGIVMHSKSVAVGGYGQGSNDEGDGEDVFMKNISIHDIELSVNEIPAVYFDLCDDINAVTTTVLKGPFGDVMDMRKMVGKENVIDKGSFQNDYAKLKYIGNPLSDAQIALAVIGNDFGLSFNSKGITDNVHFLSWALETTLDTTSGGGGSSDSTEGISLSLPQCTAFMCNGDVMHHTNKGVIGMRFDLIENIELSDIQISGLSNASPLGSYACSDYSGAHDGGNTNQLELEGSMQTDVKGISFWGGNALFDNGYVTIENLNSANGDVVGLHLMHDVVIELDDGCLLDINDLNTGTQINDKSLSELIRDNKSPYPNNFYVCNVEIDVNDNIGIQIIQTVPNNIITQHDIQCFDFYGNPIMQYYRKNKMQY